MKKMKNFYAIIVACVIVLLPVFVHAEVSQPGQTEETETTKSLSAGEEAVSGEPAEEGVGEEVVPLDPLESWNRVIFVFNDRVYFWVMKPLAKGYNAVFPEPVRVSVQNFFHNIATPIRFVNCLLQLKFESAGIELARFGLNSTAGFGGFFDVAKNNLKLQSQEKDLGLTLGHYGVGTGPYIIWPFLGPSTLRDTVGLVGDGFLSPLNYVTPWEDAFALDATQYFNYASLHIGEYEELKESSIEPYVALRDAYLQHRQSRLKK
ncbi:MAG: VacJ family lipoprotein [Nitrospirae bacterium]|nr:VacJ family lipoprotein [Nitrospirota bacterium]